MITAAPHGLSEADAQARRAAGQGNTVQLTPGRTYRQIVRENVFNFINNLLFALGITASGKRCAPSAHSTASRS